MRISRVWSLCIIGVIVWIMNANDYPAGPFVLGVVLGAIVEQNFIASILMSDGDLSAFFTRPIAGVLGVVTLTVWLQPAAISLWRLALDGRAGTPPGEPRSAPDQLVFKKGS